jgi:hypothetical protein
LISWLKSLFFGRDLKKVLEETKRVNVEGVKFTIRKVNVLDYMNGSNILQQVYDTYKVGKPDDISALQNDKKIKDYFSQVLVAGVVEPKLSFKDGGEDIFVEKLFTNQALMMGLYEKIMVLTYGKKKMT